MTNKLPMTSRTQVRRHPERSDYDCDAVYAVIDNALCGTIAFSEGGSVHAIPTIIWRENNHLYIHGSNGSRLLKTLQSGAQVCVAITEVNGLVLARSAIAHSMNYKSVCLYGVFTRVEESTKSAHLQWFLEHWMPGRWQYVRVPDQQELAATTVLSMPITEAVLKTRQGDPKDYPFDIDQPVWAGVAPLVQRWLPPQQVAEQAEADLPGKSLRPW